MFASRIAFVDVETTGTSPQTARLTEVGIVMLTRRDNRQTTDEDAVDDFIDDPSTACAAEFGEGWHVEEWSSLINPQCAIPVEIQYLTGITPQMVADAPTLATIAPEIMRRLKGAVFVAHNARFDYGFIKTELARAGLPFTAKTLCTVRLSRLLDPERSPHSLDAIISRHRLPVSDRHRALGDARVLWRFLQKVWRSHGPEPVMAAAKLLLRHPSLPSHLPPDTLKRIPRAPGVYQFFGLNDHPLYIGKSTCLRERVASHFVSDYRHERGLRLASEVRRIEWQRTPGELGALLLEAQWIRERLPAHNIALRRKLAEVVIQPWEIADNAKPAATRIKLKFRKLSDVDPLALPGSYGPFSTRAGARAALLSLCGEHKLCARCLGLERGAAGAPCFNRQLGRCLGACVGEETASGLAARLEQGMAAYRVPAWEGGPVALCETDPSSDEQSWLVFNRWLYLGCAADEAAATLLTHQAPSGAPFDSMAYRLLAKALADPPPGVRVHHFAPLKTGLDAPTGHGIVAA